MKPTKGYYCIVQYCPDLGRLEAANVGVLLFCPDVDFLEVRITRSIQRIRRFFGDAGPHWRLIRSGNVGMEDRIRSERPNLQTLEALQHFIACQANAVQITPPRWVKVFDPPQELARLFAELVGEEPKRAASKGAKAQLEAALDRRFVESGLDEKVQRGVQVRVPALQKELDVPFGFQNGRFNLVLPVPFESGRPELSVQRALRYAVEGRSLYQHPDDVLGKLQLAVVGKFLRGDEESPARVARVFDDCDVKLFSFDDLPKLIDEIRTTGKTLGPAQG